MTTGPDVTATFCATLADEWVRCGVRDVVICPGSRSTPLALALAEQAGLRVHVHHDERSAGFMALGVGLATGKPAVVITTSGTAAVELHPAVVEAHQAGVPLIVATADRPPELQDVGAPQTIDQTHLFGRSTRWFSAPGVPDEETATAWRYLAARAVSVATNDAGPVHLNLAFREPLLGTTGELPAADTRRVAEVKAEGPPHSSPVLEDRLLATKKGLLIAGGGCGVEALESVAAWTEAAGWPIIADARSGLHSPNPNVISAADAILRHEWTAEKLRPAVVVHLGEPLTSKVLNAWVAATGAEQVMVRQGPGWIDPAQQATQLIDCSVADFAAAQLKDLSRGPAIPTDQKWLSDWTNAESAAQSAIARVLAAHGEATEPGVARGLVAALPDSATLLVSSSMPIRDVEWYGLPRTGLRVLANRGANGIDGVTSTAVGIALAATTPTALLIGDVAFLHDSNALLRLAARNIDLTIVVLDNDGGGIFSFLPQNTDLVPGRFEQLFGTPHGVDLAALCQVHGLAVNQIHEAVEIEPAIAAAVATPGVHVLIVRTDRESNLAIHREVDAEVQAALD